MRAPVPRHSADALVDIVGDYRRFGYVVVASPFGQEEIAQWRRECDRLWALPGTQEASEFRVDLRDTLDGRRVPERLDPVIDASPVFAELARDERVLRVARALLGENVVLFKDKLIVKTPGTMGYRTHQDFSARDRARHPAESPRARKPRRGNRCVRRTYVWPRARLPTHPSHRRAGCRS